MNLLLCRPEHCQDGEIQASERQTRHLQTTLMAKPGDTIRVGLLEGKRGQATLLSYKGDHARLRVEHLSEEPPAKLNLTLLMAMPRPKVFRRILQAVVALGVDRLILINSYRVEKSYWQTPWLQPDSLAENIQLGLEQSGDTRSPDILIRKRFKPFVEDELPALSEGVECLLAHPGPVHEKHCINRHQAQMLAVGPEGGFIPYEIEKLCESGFRIHSLGPRILRVDTAISALIGQLYL